MTSDTTAQPAGGTPDEAPVALPDADDVGPVVALGLLVDEARTSVERELDYWASAARAVRLVAQRVTLAVCTIAVLSLVLLVTLSVGVLVELGSRFGYPAAMIAVSLPLVLAIMGSALYARAQIRAFERARTDRQDH